VPAGFTSDGLPIGLLDCPANSAPLLVSLAAELEALNGWVTKQPTVWHSTGKWSRRSGRQSRSPSPTKPADEADGFT
jgi:hypothetical protein